MSKLAKKFIVSLSAILIFVIACALYLNANFIERYFLYQEKQDLMRVCDELITGKDLAETITQLEDRKDVLIVQVESTDDNELLNERLRTAFQEKGLGFQKFWLWDVDQQSAIKNGRQLRLYGQEKLQYSLLVGYVHLNNNFIASVKIIPAMESTISLINLVTALVFSCATLLMLLLIFFLIKKITAPLEAIGDTAKAIAILDFQTVSVKTGDELEVLAENVNHMSGKLQTAHQDLQTKNRQMETLLANVSHDLKTPVSLIKAYASGIKDDMDDGTFLDTIILQNEKLEQMIERLLDLAKMQTLKLSTERLDLSILLRGIVSEYHLQAEKRGLAFQCQIDSDIIQTVHKEVVQTIFSNLISNAVKYAVGDRIAVNLKSENGVYLFQIQNEVNPEIRLESERLWEPFYVAEQSRNKDISGTGLGLPIVRAAAQKCGYDCSCHLTEKQICFTIQF